MLNEKKIYDKDWKLIQSVVKVLGSFKSATEKLSKESACISEYIPTVTVLLKSLETLSDEDEGVKSLKKHLFTNLKNRTERIEDMEQFTMATLLNTRFKDKFFYNESKKNEARRLLLLMLMNESTEASSLAPAAEIVPENSDEGSIVGGDDFFNMFAQITQAAQIEA